MRIVPNDMFFSWVESEIAEGHSVRFRLKGISMLPLIRGEKDDVLLVPCNPQELKPMDVVLFRYRGKHLLHRIIKREGDNLLIQGDGCVVAQERCTINDVVGKVQAIIRPNGREISVESRKWRFDSWLWWKLTPFRFIILKFFA